MNISNAAAQTIEAKAQKGFSLIELLVVVAIIGVLAAAGIVGYTSYLEGVKSDTHKNNVIALKKGLDVIAVARGGGLNVNPSECNTTNVPTATAAYASLGTSSPAAGVLGCVAKVASDGKFKSPITPSATDYVVAASAVNGGGVSPWGCATATQAGLIVISSQAIGQVRLTACDKAGTAVVHTETIDLK